MMRNWTIARQLGVALGVMLALTLLVAGLGIYALRTVVASKDAVIDVRAQNLIRGEQLVSLLQRQRGAVRDYLLFNNESFISEVNVAERQLGELVARLEGTVITPEGAAMMRDIRRLAQEYRTTTESIIGQRARGTTVAELSDRISTEMAPRRVALEGAVAAFRDREQRLLEEGRNDASTAAQRIIFTEFIISALAIIIGALGAVFLTRTLARQIDSALHNVQSSSAELQAAANQQASSSREQATAMAEITTTIAELLATSRQIADSAQRVARIAEETASSAQAGQTTVGHASDAVGGVRKQVDGIVTHMLDLGRKSQQIGGIVDVINELADQTNILSINAAIEAAGAGEAGRRFGVVADEIRKLADRVAGSTKEIRSLVEDVRAAVNTTVMTTEATSKSADVGVQQFAEVSSAFRQIARLVGATTESAKEIELSTKQQASAVEQVNMGVADVAQGAKETEVSSSQMLDTVSRLTVLAHDLARLIGREARA